MLKTKKPRTSCRQCGELVLKPSYTYCSNRCQHDFQHDDYIRRWKAGEVSGGRGKGNERVARPVRRYMLKKAGHKCEDCGWCKVNPTTGLIPLTVDHIDGNATNTVEENLRVLCPNCHSLTPTYGGANAGNGRAHRRRNRMTQA